MSAVSPYLFLSGRCEEALEFYTKALDAKVGMVLRFNESPDPPPPGVLAPGFENKVMHAAFEIGKTQLYASDGCDDTTRVSGFSLSLSFPTVEEVEQAFNALADGGTISMPLAKTFWNERYGMLTDRFGVSWMFCVADDPAC
ncbi:VOC family protein [Planctomicrobium sp. SH527]|uniref:VOC family protein n=1 Tax=Planctomicrobium sp. SH527 TaxID=3448123 RepID=UPI003F5C65BA